MLGNGTFHSWPQEEDTAPVAERTHGGQTVPVIFLKKLLPLYVFKRGYRWYRAWLHGLQMVKSLYLSPRCALEILLYLICERGHACRPAPFVWVRGSIYSWIKQLNHIHTSSPRISCFFFWTITSACMSLVIYLEHNQSFARSSKYKSHKKKHPNFLAQEFRQHDTASMVVLYIVLGQFTCFSSVLLL